MIMDNPFGEISSPHLLKPMMEMAKKTNTQLICFTDHKGDAIYSCFDNIYIYTLVPSVLGNGYILKGEPGDKTIASAHITIEGKTEQMQLVF